MVSKEKHIKNFFEHLDEIKQTLSRKDVLLFLDYDGTLTPIVATPDLAILSEEMRAILKRVCSKYKVSIVSGRATDDVRNKVNIDGIFYAGSHGFEIISPDGKVKINEEAKNIRPIIDEVFSELKMLLKGIQGALVEHVKYTVSTHYRLVKEKDFLKVKHIVEAVLKKYPQLRKTQGKKVFEIRPKINWDKGKAVEWILDVLQFNDQKHRVIYIGDDTTDEDAFGVLEGKGFGILVAEETRETRAAYQVRNTDEVKKVLEFLVK